MSEGGSSTPPLFSDEARHVQNLLARSHSFYKNGHLEAALDLATQAYDIDPRMDEVLLLLGAIYYQLHDLESSVRFNAAALEVNPNFPQALSNLGNCLRDYGRIIEAIRMYELAIANKPNFADAHYNLAGAYVSLGRIDEAVNHFHRAIHCNPNLFDAYISLARIYATPNPEAAKKYYLQALSVNPSSPLALTLLGDLFRDGGDLGEAEKYYLRAIDSDSTYDDAYLSLGVVCKDLGCYGKASSYLQTATRLRPNSSVAFGLLASVYHNMGNFELAVSEYQKAIKLDPSSSDLRSNLGNVMRDLGKMHEALVCYRSALTLNPHHPHTFNNMGTVYKEMGLFKDALDCYQRAISFMPGFAAAYSNMASLLKDMGEYEQALSYYEEAIRIDPLFADAYSNMGNLLKELGRLDEAISKYEMAIQLKPHFADAHNNLACAYKDCGRVPEAIEYYRKTLALKPDSVDAFCNLVHSQLFICDWTDCDSNFARLIAIVDKQLRAGQLPSVQPFHALTYPVSRKMFLQICHAYSMRAYMNVAGLLQRGPLFSSYHIGIPGEKIRVGYVSSDFANHPLAHLMQHVFYFHDKSRFEIFCFALTPDDQSIYRKNIMHFATQFHDISALSPEQAAKFIHMHRIHVLINLNGYTKGARNEIFVLQPAPIQVSYMGFPGTTGSTHIQYFVVDHVVAPPELESSFSEKLVHMPHSYFVNDHLQSFPYLFEESAIANGPTREHYGLPNDKVIYCMFNQLYKLDRHIFDVWCKILKRVPHSVLWLLQFPAHAEPHVIEEAIKRGIPRERIIFTDVAPKEEHTFRGCLADVFLDTPACNAHTTGTDILWAGTPMVTLPKKNMASRVAASLLSAIDAPELIASDEKEYEEIAVDLGLHPGKLRALKRKLRRNRLEKPLFDTRRWVLNWETGIEKMYEKCVSGLPPDHIDVPDYYESRGMDAPLCQRPPLFGVPPPPVILPQFPPPGMMHMSAMPMIPHVLPQMQSIQHIVQTPTPIPIGIPVQHPTFVPRQPSIVMSHPFGAHRR